MFVTVCMGMVGAVSVSKDHELDFGHLKVRCLTSHSCEDVYQADGYSNLDRSQERG